MKNARGSITLVVCLVLGLAGALALVKPKFLDGDSKRAAQSEKASSHVEAAVKESSTAENNKGAVAAASVQSIKNASSDLPPSPATDFIRREVDVPLALLPKADYQALLEAEKRRVAYMQGRLEEADKSYAKMAKTTEELLKAKDEADKKLQQAFLDRRAVDSELAEVAAARLAAERQRNLFIVIAVVAVVLWLVSKFYGVSPSSLGRIVADVRSGVDPIVAIDTHTYPHVHAAIKKASKLAQ